MRRRKSRQRRPALRLVPRPSPSTRRYRSFSPQRCRSRSPRRLVEDQQRLVGMWSHMRQAKTTQVWRLVVGAILGFLESSFECRSQTRLVGTIAAIHRRQCRFKVAWPASRPARELNHCISQNVQNKAICFSSILAGPRSGTAARSLFSVIARALQPGHSLATPG